MPLTNFIFVWRGIISNMAIQNVEKFHIFLVAFDFVFKRFGYFIGLKKNYIISRLSRSVEHYE